jgi:hypothetical protein
MISMNLEQRCIGPLKKSPDAVAGCPTERVLQEK